MTTALVKEGLLAILDSLERWRDVARQNGLTPNEITRMAAAFEHEGRISMSSYLLNHGSCLRG
ncbi:MAG: hypothetical protein LBJ59_03925 [Zoogloeaceae bacterium]|jgi:hypothetical protein|nr:hypothetical protein [Zoogloeaceae bacterium]